jgi:hypothetical protein
MRNIITIAFIAGCASAAADQTSDGKTEAQHVATTEPLQFAIDCLADNPVVSEQVGECEIGGTKVDTFACTTQWVRFELQIEPGAPLFATTYREINTGEQGMSGLPARVYDREITTDAEGYVLGACQYAGDVPVFDAITLFVE